MARINQEAAEEDRPMLDALARRVRQRRQAFGIGTVELGERARLSHSFISRLERGLVPRPTLSELRRVAEALEYPSLGAFLEGVTQPSPDADDVQIIGRNADLAPRFVALAEVWGSAPPAVQAMVAATLDTLAAQMGAGAQAAEDQAPRRTPRPRPTEASRS